MKTTKRILVDCHKFDEDLQGITTYIEGLYKELIKTQSIDFFLVANKIEALQKIFGKSSNVHYIKLPSKSKWKRLLVDLPRIIKKHQIDFAHFQYVVPPIKYCQYIVTIHDVLFLDFPEYFSKGYIKKNHFLFKKSAKLSDVVFTVSPYSKKRIEHYFNLKREVYITPNAVNSYYYQVYNKAIEKEYVFKKYSILNYFLLISRIEPRKNHDLLLQVFVENKYYLQHDLVFIGKRDLEYRKFEKLLQNLPAEVLKKIHFFENIDNEELLHFIRGAELAVYPSFAEGFGIPPLETLAAKIPTVCSNTTAMQDFTFLKNFQFNPKSKVSLQNSIEYGLSHEIDEKMIQILREQYSWKQSAENYLKALNQIK